MRQREDSAEGGVSAHIAHTTAMACKRGLLDKGGRREFRRRCADYALAAICGATFSAAVFFNLG